MYDSLQQGNDESTEAYLHRAQDILKHIHHTSDMSSITTIGMNHAKILTCLKDSRLCNKLAKSKAKKWVNMAQVLQDIAHMAMDFERSHGYSIPTFKVQHISASNSSNSYRSSKPPTNSVQQPSTQTDKPKCWHCQRDHLKKDCLTAPKQGSLQPKYKTTKEKQCNLIKAYHKRFQDRRSQINEISTPSEDDSYNNFNKFFSEFKSMMMEDSDDSCAWLVTSDKAIINEVFIDTFHALYNIQVGNLHTQALFDTDVLINAISFKFYSTMQQHLKCYPPAEKLSQQMVTA